MKRKRKLILPRSRRNPAAKKTSVDAASGTVFGSLSRVVGDLWERPLQVELFGKLRDIRLAVRIDEWEGVEPQQVSAFKMFNQDTADRMGEAEMALLSYYHAECDEFRSRRGITDDNDKDVPIVTSVRQLARLLDPESIYFSYANPDPTFGLLAKCTWEPEHGVAVKFVIGKVVEVGFQDIIL